MYISGLGLQWLVSVFEIWYGFRLVLYLTDLTDSIKLWGNILRWAGIIVFGSLLAFNRTIAFFSFGMFVLQIIFSILCMLCIVRRKPAFISCVIITYYTMVALQDFAFAFIGMIYDSSSFEQIIYFGDSIWKSIIYFTSRLFVSLLIGVLLRKKDLSGDVLGAYWKPFLAFDLFLLFVLRTYQTFIIVLLNDKGQYIEIMTKEILASLIFLLAMAYVTAFLFLKNSYTANQNNFLLLQEKLLKEKYKEVAAEIENQHKVVHDVKHHLLVLQGLLKEKEIQRMDAYLADVEKEFTVSEMKKWTENEIVNLILNQKIVSAQKDYALAFASFPNISWEGHCMYCSHCAPCPKKIDVASVTKFLNLAKAQGEVPETVREHYEVLEHHAGECIRCGACETRCPFKVPIIENMKQAAEVFGK